MRHQYCILFGLLILTGCQTLYHPSGISVEEAKNIAVSFEKTSFETPPRSLSLFGKLPQSYHETVTAQCSYVSKTLDPEAVNAVAQKLDDDLMWKLRSRAKDEAKAGRLDNALLYAKALARFAGYKSEKNYGHSLASIYSAQLNDFESARKFFSRVIFKQHHDQACHLRNQYWRRKTIGYMALSQGQPERAQTNFTHAVARLEELRAYTQTTNNKPECSARNMDHDVQMKLAIAEALLDQGKLLQSESIAREMWTYIKYSSTRGKHFKVDIMRLLSRIYAAQGRLQDAYNLALKAIKLEGSGCKNTGSDKLFSALHLAGNAAASLGKWEEALRIFDDIKENAIAVQPSLWEQKYKISNQRALAFLKIGAFEKALELFELSTKKAIESSNASSFKALEAQAFSAMAQAYMGQHHQALSTMRDVFPVMLTKWRESSGEAQNLASRNAQLRLLGEVYIRLLVDVSLGGDPNNQDQVKESFQIADALGTRSVQSALTQSAARYLSDDLALQDLIRQRQDLEKKLAIIRIQYTDGLGNKNITPETIQSLQQLIQQADQALTSLEQEIGDKIPEYASLTNPRPITLLQTQEMLGEKEAVVVMFSGDDRLFTWGVPKAGNAKVHVSYLGRNVLKDKIDALRDALAPEVQFLGDIREYDITLGYEIYENTIGAVRSVLGDTSLVNIVSEGPLSTIPFGVLPTNNAPLKQDQNHLFDRYKDVAWLIKDFALSNLPSVSSLQILRGVARNQPPQYAFAGFGDPWFNRNPDANQKARTEQSLRSAGHLRGGSLLISLRNSPKTNNADSATVIDLPFLPDTGDEIIAVSSALGGSLGNDVFLGIDASERQVKTLNESGELQKYRTISFATHGLIPGDLDGLSKPALALSEPSKEDIVRYGDDGLLTSDEIMGLKLNADWAILSACNTAAGDGKGAEAVSGLGRAFFYAGARSILVSNWPVHSQATTDLMERLFNHYADQQLTARGAALQSSMLSMIENGAFMHHDKVAFTYAHPLFWAPFTLVGDGM